LPSAGEEAAHGGVAIYQDKRHTREHEVQRRATAQDRPATAGEAAADAELAGFDQMDGSKVPTVVDRSKERDAEPAGTPLASTMSGVQFLSAHGARSGSARG
jgi:hypothetical protein